MFPSSAVLLKHLGLVVCGKCNAFLGAQGEGNELADAASSSEDAESRLDDRHREPRQSKSHRRKLRPSVVKMAGKLKARKDRPPSPAVRVVIPCGPEGDSDDLDTVDSTLEAGDHPTEDDEEFFSFAMHTMRGCRGEQSPRDVHSASSAGGDAHHRRTAPSRRSKARKRLSGALRRDKSGSLRYSPSHRHKRPIDPQVVDLLSRLHLSHLASTFEAEQIDMAALLLMSEDDLQSMGIRFGPRTKIMAAIEGVQVGNPPN